MRLPFFHTRHASIQAHALTIDAIEDGMLRLRGGQIRAIVEVESAHGALAGEQEERAFLQQYVRFLNSLSFPIQILVEIQPVDIAAYLAQLERSAQLLPDALALLALDHAAFLRRLAQSRTLKQRHVYLVIPAPEQPVLRRWLPRWTAATGEESFDAAYVRKQLTARCDEIVKGLGACNLTARRLGDPALAELFSGSWCFDLARRQRVQGLLREYRAPVVRAAQEDPACTAG